jgi:dihydroflavonol-4-reductase
MESLTRKPGSEAAPTLVTGASGCVGGHLALRLRREGQPVRALVRPTSKTDHLRAAGVTLVTGDIRNPAEVEAAVAGCTSVYPLAGVFRSAGQPDS